MQLDMGLINFDITKYQIYIISTYILSMNLLSAVFLLLLPLVFSLNTLVILDNKQIENTHKTFFNKLKNEGHLDIKYSFQKDIKLKIYDQYQYNTIVVFCASEQLSDSSVTVQDLVDFFDNGGNLIIAGDIDISRGFRKLFYAFGVQVDEENHQTKDAFNHFGAPNTIVTTNIQKIYPYNSYALPKGGKLLYRGVGLKLANYITNQLYGLVKGEPTTYSYNYALEQAVRVGDDITLVAAVQGLRNTRAVLTGSLDFFSDQFLENTAYDNNDFVQQLINWVNQKTGILRVRNIKHWSKNQDDNQKVFTVTSRIHFEADIEQYDHIKQEWKPYVADDIMLQFVMLDPWVITKLRNQKGTARYSAQFDSPTKEGIYQFKIIYEKAGFNFIKQTERVTLRPKKHDQFQRFLVTASPYYMGVFATIFGAIIFTIVFLYSRFQQKPKKQ